MTIKTNKLRVGTQAVAHDRRHRAVPLPRAWSLRAADMYFLIAITALLIGAMWVRHGGISLLGSTSGIFTAAGEIAALYGAYLILIQLILMSRAPWLDQIFGQDRITWAHRWVGFTAIWLLIGHAIFTTLGYGLGIGASPVDEFASLLFTYPYVLWSAVALIIFIGVGISSVAAMRRKASYETWYTIHLYTYIAVALAFLHQLFVGVDFTTDQLASLYWIALYVAAFGLLFAFRFGHPLLLNARHRFRVVNVVTEGPGVTSLYLSGHNLDRLPVRAGQWFRLRFLTSRGWFRGHPFSLSAAPNGQYLRFTIKSLGDYTAELQRADIGTRVFLEGPYGAMTGAARSRPGALMIAGGIGITPLRSLIEEMSMWRDDLVLLYRASDPAEIVFRNEIDELARGRNIVVHYLVGKRGSPQLPHDPLDPKALRTLIPDIGYRDIFICGPSGMMSKVLDSIYRLRIPQSQVHYERFAF
jgi:predicted ferric reductase